MRTAEHDLVVDGASARVIDCPILGHETADEPRRLTFRVKRGVEVFCRRRTTMAERYDTIVMAAGLGGGARLWDS
jgi:hypothetical protein